MVDFASCAAQEVPHKRSCEIVHWAKVTCTISAAGAVCDEPRHWPIEGILWKRRLGLIAVDIRLNTAYNHRSYFDAEWSKFAAKAFAKDLNGGLGARVGHYAVIF